MMAKAGITFGLLLCALTVMTLLATTEKHITQFVPMMLGIPMLFLGVVSLNPHRRPTAVSVSGVLAVVGMLLGIGRLAYVAAMYVRGDKINPLSIQTLAAMTATCLVFGLGVVFWARRRQRRRAGREPTTPSAKSDPAPTNHSAEPNPKFKRRSTAETGTNPYQSPPVIDDDADRGLPPVEVSAAVHQHDRYPSPSRDDTVPSKPS